MFLKFNITVLIYDLILDGSWTRKKGDRVRVVVMVSGGGGWYVKKLNDTRFGIF